MARPVRRADDVATSSVTAGVAPAAGPTAVVGVLGRECVAAQRPLAEGCVPAGGLGCRRERQLGLVPVHGEVVNQRVLRRGRIPGEICVYCKVAVSARSPTLPACLRWWGCESARRPTPVWP